MGNVALVTGASSGIGEQLARIHAEHGGDLVLVARRQERLQALADELTGEHDVGVSVIAADLTDEYAPEKIFDRIAEDGTDIDVLINNAGFGGLGKFHERDWALDRDMIQVNIVGLTALTRLFLPEMVERNAGKILNVSSTAGEIPGPLQAVYFATKAYVTSFSNALVEELSDTGVTVTALLPGATDTEFAARSGMEDAPLFQQTASARSVAEDGYNAMLNGALNVVSGVPLERRLMYSLAPLLPRRLVMRGVRKAQEQKQDED